ncbi:MAG: hypothetical protein KF819_17875 [Labilithrix sp.]|nr:hypothetical protein [Labilithrix sp.]
MRALTTTLTACAVLSMTANCQRGHETRPGAAYTTGAQIQAPAQPTIMNDDAAMRLAQARCRRESLCDNVGAFRRFPNHDACLREVFVETQETVVPEECPAGVDQIRLTRCIADVYSEKCGEAKPPLDAPASALGVAPIACHREQLCLVR